ncbi:MAG: dienelactone hydrolase family protein [Acidobacteriota bacterium]
MTWTSVPVSDGSELELWVARPEMPRAAAVIVLHEIRGVSAHIRDVAASLAAAGFVAIAPDLFHRTARRFASEDPAAGLPHARALTPEGCLADLRTAHAWLAGDAQADASRVAAWGFCMGGRIAHRANVALPLAASIAFYGGGLPDTPLRHELERLHGATLLVWGGRDPHVTRDARRQLADAIEAAGRPYVDVVFGEADHGFFRDRASSASRQAWQLARTFLGEHLSAGPG